MPVPVRAHRTPTYHPSAGPWRLLRGREEQPLQQARRLLQESRSIYTPLPGVFRCHFLDNPFAFTQELPNPKSFFVTCSSRIFSMTSVAMHQGILKQGGVGHQHICISFLFLL